MTLSNPVRSLLTPEFVGITSHEVLAKSALNRVPGKTPPPFGWTINPYRGCSHACVYCFARRTYEYLDLDSGTNFDSEIVVKVNEAEVLAQELAKPGWGHHPVALGTNTDPYRRAEGRYRLKPGSERVSVDLALSIAVFDDELQQSMVRNGRARRRFADRRARCRPVPHSATSSILKLRTFCCWWG